jgi:signal transduction histidine kinase
VSQPEPPASDAHARLAAGFPAALLPELSEDDASKVLERWRLAAVGQLAGGIAHEINNPLFAILGTVEFMLEEAPRDPELRERLERIQRAGVEIRETVRSLVDFAREPLAETRLLSLEDVCVDIVRLVRRATLGRGVELREVYPAEQVSVRACASQVKQVLLALVLNAQQAQPEGGEIELRVERRAEDGLVHVRDRGPGLDARARELAFEPFLTTRLDRGASGLGLTVARSLARLQGGDLEVASRRGRGSVFTLRLPAGR